MRMFAAGVNFQLGVNGPTEAVVGNHSANGAFDKELRTAFTARLESLRFVTPNKPGEAHVFLGDFFFSEDLDLARVDDNDEIAGIDVRGENGFVFAAKQRRSAFGHASEHLVFRVNNPPLAGYFVGLGRKSCHKSPSFVRGGKIWTLVDYVNGLF